MKHIIFILFISLMSNSLILAQGIEKEESDFGLQTDTISQGVSANTETEIKIKESDYLRLIGYRDSIKVLNDKHQKLDNACNSLRDQNKTLNDSLRFYMEKYTDEQKQNKSLMDKLIKGDKQIIGMASFPLYFPYNEYIVNYIAIPAYESVQNDSLKKQYMIRYKLLKSYKADISEMADLLKSIHQECNGPFASSGQSEGWINKITQSRIFARYKQYDDWRNTYIGYMLTEVVDYLKIFNRQTTPQKIKEKIDELDRCIETGK